MTDLPHLTEEEREAWRSVLNDVKDALNAARATVAARDATIAELRAELDGYVSCVRCEVAIEPHPRVNWCEDCNGPDCSTCGAEGVACDADCPERIARESRRTYLPAKDPTDD